MKIILKPYRIALKLSQKQLANKAGVSRVYLNEIEKNRHFPSSLVLFKIAKALKICPKNLIDFCIECPFRKCCKKILPSK